MKKLVMFASSKTNSTLKRFARAAPMQRVACLLIFLVFALNAATADGNKVGFITGEGNQPGAELTIDETYNFILGIYCIQNKGRGVLELSLYIDFADRGNLPRNLPPSLAELMKVEHSNVGVCLNQDPFCKWSEWIASDEGADEIGHGLQIQQEFVIGIQRNPISAIGIQLSPQQPTYRFRGNVDSILRKICITRH